VAAAVGAVMTLWLTRSRVALGAVAAAIAIVALALVASSGLPIQDRYVFLIAALATIFGGAGLFGWQTLERGHPRRRLWQAGAVVIAVAIAASVLWQIPRFHKTFDSAKPADQSLPAQQRIAGDLIALVSSHKITAGCGAISVPYATPVPLLALYLHTSPANVVVRAVSRGIYLVAASPAVYTSYQLDPADPQRIGGVPAGFRLTAANRSWRVYSSCG